MGGLSRLIERAHRGLMLLARQLAQCQSPRRRRPRCPAAALPGPRRPGPRRPRSARPAAAPAPASVPVLAPLPLVPTARSWSPRLSAAPSPARRCTWPGFAGCVPACLPRPVPAAQPAACRLPRRLHLMSSMAPTMDVAVSSSRHAVLGAGGMGRSGDQVSSAVELEARAPPQVRDTPRLWAHHPAPGSAAAGAPGPPGEGQADRVGGWHLAPAWAPTIRRGR